MRKLMILAAIAALPLASAATAQQPAGPAGPAAPSDPGKLILFEALNYAGDMVQIDNPRTRVTTPWNIRSVAIHPGERWQICARPRFQAPCIVLDRSVNDANLIGVNGQIGSARPAPADAHN